MRSDILELAGLHDACVHARLRPDFVAALEAERLQMRRPEFRARLEQLHQRLFVTQAVAGEEIAAWPLPGGPGAETLPPLFYAFLFLSGMTHMQSQHAARGIPEAISRDTFSDLDLWIEDHRRRSGHPGLSALAWLHNHFTGRLVALGRLQYRFEEFPAKLAARAPAPCPKAGAPVLSVHVPASGPLDADACERSLRDAAGFFPRHYPDRPVRGYVCYSWLLDPALAEHLPTESNIVRFQRRFSVFTLPQVNDAPFRELFAEAWADLQNCRPRSALQSALRDRLLSGKNWSVHAGVLRAGTGES